MKKHFKISVLIILFVSILGIKAEASSYPKCSIKPTEGVESSYSDYGYSYETKTNSGLTTNAITQNGAISSYASEIYKVSSGYVKGYGKTVATMLVDEIGYTIYFQMWDGYNWINVSSVHNSGMNTTYIQDYHFKVVTPNRYYRVNVEHYVIDNGIKDVTISTSSYIFVN